jgi:hypothetical protein
MYTARFQQTSPPIDGAHAQRQIRTLLHRPRSRLSVLEVDFSVVERASLDVDD